MHVGPKQGKTLVTWALSWESLPKEERKFKLLFVKKLKNV